MVGEKLDDSTYGDDYMGIYPINYYLDYTFIYWQDPASGMEDYTHQVGLTLRFSRIAYGFAS